MRQILIAHGPEQVEQFDFPKDSLQRKFSKIHYNRSILNLKLRHYDSNVEEDARIDARTSFVVGRDRSIDSTIQHVLTDNNPLALQFRHAYERRSRGEDVRLSIHQRLEGVDRRFYNSKRHQRQEWQGPGKQWVRRVRREKTIIGRMVSC
ncbi:hypothetical protein Btru_061535 [Bulinus truncatus]|nr:hypothetical protein Btru_061535 [Bulinus truncatus]